MSNEKVNFIFKLTDRINKPLRRIKKQLEEFEKRTNKLSTRMSKFGRNLARYATLPILLLGAASIKMAKDLNEGMANVATLIPKNLKRIKELRTGVQELSIATATMTSDMVNGLYQVVSAFGDNEDTLNRLNTSARAAKAGVATVTDSINLLSAITKGYGDITDKATKYAADLAFTTVKLGQTTFPELASSIGRVVPLAAKLNVAQKELFTGFATLTGVTGTAAEVSTQMAAVLRAMLKPTTTLRKTVKKVGFATAEQMINTLGLVDSLKVLMKTTGGSGEATAKLFGRAEALTAVFALTGKQADTYAEKLEAMKNATGALNEAFEEQTNGINKIGFKWDQLKVRLVVLAQKLGEVLLPALEVLVDVLVPLINSFNSLSKTTKAAIIIFMGLIALLGPLLIFFAAITKAILIFQIVGAPTILIIAGIIAAIIGLIALALLIKKNWGKIVPVFKNLWKKIKIIFLSFSTIFMPFLNIPILIIKNWGKLIGFFKGLWGKIDALMPSWMKKLYMKIGGGEKTTDAIKNSKQVMKSQTEIKIKLESKDGAAATIDYVRKRRGTSDIKVMTQGFLGRTFTGGM